MKIAMMVRGYIKVPRPSDIVYAPIDLAVDIAEGLSARGHKVDFYAPLGSSLEKGVRIRSENVRPLIEDRQDFQDLLANVEKMNHHYTANWENKLVEAMFRRARAGEYDILHFHHPEVALPHAQLNQDVPVVYTLHDPIYDWYHDMLNMYQSPNQHFVSISDNQRKGAPELAYLNTIHNGINLRKYPLSIEPEDFLLYVGRIVPEKGVKEAIEVARRTNQRLLIIGPVFNDAMAYFNSYVQPELDDQILYLGYMEQSQLAAYYRKAKALLTPILWEEPFGLTTIEAMASGTPVISFNRGAGPEIISHGQTGYVVKDVGEMAEAVFQISSINRRSCRDHVRLNFSAKQMVDGYEQAFKKVLVGQRTNSSPKIIKLDPMSKRWPKQISLSRLDGVIYERQAPSPARD